MQHRSNGHIVADLGVGRGHGQRALLSLWDEHLAAADERPARRGMGRSARRADVKPATITALAPSANSLEVLEAVGGDRVLTAGLSPQVGTAGMSSATAVRIVAAAVGRPGVMPGLNLFCQRCSDSARLGR